jgi:hypothetical protein
VLPLPSQLKSPQFNAKSPTVEDLAHTIRRHLTTTFTGAVPAYNKGPIKISATVRQSQPLSTHSTNSPKLSICSFTAETAAKDREQYPVTVTTLRCCRSTSHYVQQQNRQIK